MLTAGHCATWGTTWYSNPFSVDTSAGEECVPGSSITGSAPWSGHDWAIESLNGACGGVWSAIHDFKTGENFEQQGAVHSYVGETVCHYGVVTPERCGKVLSINDSLVVEYESGNWTVQHLDVICGLAQHGDSGGPVSDYTYRGAATGILISLGSGNSSCGEKGEFFTEEDIFPILEETDTYVY
jgi:streptogrisin B